MPLDCSIRHEEPSDEFVVEQLCREAFWNLHTPGCDEHYLVHVLRDHPDYIPELSFVIENDEGTVIGCIFFTKSSIKHQDGRLMETLTFGPVAIHPSYQRKGIGSKLISHAIKKVSEHPNNYRFIIILGFPKNYCRYGFKSCQSYNITDSTGRFPLGQLVLDLNPDLELPKGPWIFQYSPVYDNLSEEETIKYDKNKFSPKEKMVKPCQVEFDMCCKAHLDLESAVENTP
ncbi:hypothetical protein GEMRC1_004240 [Eukaryota sp. GEM-RC1]